MGREEQGNVGDWSGGGWGGGDRLRRKGTRRSRESRVEGPLRSIILHRRFPKKDAALFPVCVLPYVYCKPAANRKRHYRSTPAESSPVDTASFYAHGLIYVCLILGVNLRNCRGKAPPAI